MARHVGDMPYKICLKWVVQSIISRLYWWGAVPFCVHLRTSLIPFFQLLLYVTGKDFVLYFSQFLLEVMPKQCVEVPCVLTRIVEGLVNCSRGSSFKTRSLSSKSFCTYMKVRERLCLRKGKVCMWWQTGLLEWEANRPLETAVLVKGQESRTRGSSGDLPAGGDVVRKGGRACEKSEGTSLLLSWVVFVPLDLSCRFLFPISISVCEGAAWINTAWAFVEKLHGCMVCFCSLWSLLLLFMSRKWKVLL